MPTMTQTAEIPEPGSDAADELGCTCPMALNNWGQAKPLSGWKIAAGCPLHDPSKDAA